MDRRPTQGASHRRGHRFQPSVVHPAPHRLVISHPVKRLALSPLALLVASLCSACLASTGGNPDDNPPAVETRAPSSEPTGESRQPSSEPTDGGTPKRETLAFGRSYTWDDGVSLTVGRPKKFEPSEYAVVEDAKHYLRFSVTVVNKSDKPIELGLTYISVQSSNEAADEVFDSGSGLRGPPDTKVPKGRESGFDVGFGVTDPKDVVLEIALHDNFVRPSLLYST
jgi:hypothetical protein